MHDLPFQVGELAESRSFQVGFRGAWFRCKIREMRKSTLNALLEYFDYTDQKLTWMKLYQKPPKNIGKSKGFDRELMVRPSFPTIYHESEKFDVNTITEEIVIVDNMWKVGDLVDWWTDDCYWSGRVTKILENGKVQIDLLPPPLGEGSSYEVLSKDLRPSLNWCPEKGWTVPMPMLQEGGHMRPCARIISPNSGGVANTHATDGAVTGCEPAERTNSHSSQNCEGLLDLPDGSMGRSKQCNAARNCMDIDESDNKLGKACFSDSVSSSHILDASIENLERTTTIDGGHNDEYPSKKMRCNKSLSLNSMSSNTIEAAILDLEELVNRIKWLKGKLNIGVPLSGTKKPSWEFLHHAPCK